MDIGGTSGVGGPGKIYPRLARPEQQASAVNQAAAGDSVEISDAARLHGALSLVPEIRTDKVAAAREMIAAGTMDTPDRMDAALDRLLDDAMAGQE